MDVAEPAYPARRDSPEAGPFPLGPRVLAIVAGAALAAYFAAIAARLHAQDLVIAGTVAPVIAFPVALFLVLVGLIPGTVQQRLTRVSKVDLRDAAHGVVLVVFTVTMFFIFGVFAVLEGVVGFESVILGHGGGVEDPFQPVEQSVLLTNLVVATFLFTVPVLVWLTFVNGLSTEGALRALGFRGRDALPTFVQGAGFAVAAILGLLVLTLIVHAAGVTLPENEQALAIAGSVTLVAAVVVAALSSLGEEILFRGFLLPRIGMLPQALLFAISHASYLNVMQLVVTFALGLGFAWLYRRTGNLWAPVGAHFAFNFIMLASAILAA